MFKLNSKKTSNGISTQEGLPSVALAQEGSVIIFTLLILGSMLAITLALATIFLPKIRVISDAGAGSVGAIYSADSAIEWCLYTYRENPPLPSPVMANGATYTFIPPTGCQPSAPSTPLNVQAVGTYHSVSRSLQVNTDITP